jgi:hypothetical protein
MRYDCCTTIRDPRGFSSMGRFFMSVPIPGGYGSTISSLTERCKEGAWPLREFYLSIIHSLS